MIHTTFRRGQFNITVEAIFYKGYCETLEEPALDDSFEYQRLSIDETEYEPEELADLLEITETELDKILYQKLKQQMEYDEKYNF
jgi:hypothetical protein